MTPKGQLDDEEGTVQQKLVIQFTDGGPTDGPSPYWIHYTDYHFAVVGGPTDNYVWLLAREPIIKESDLWHYTDYVGFLGYDLDRVFLQKNVQVIEGQIFVFTLNKNILITKDKDEFLYGYERR